MAKNLRAKIPKSDSLIIYDVNQTASSRFIEEVGIATSTLGDHEGSIKIAGGVQEVAENSVRQSSFLPTICPIEASSYSYDENYIFH